MTLAECREHVGDKVLYHVIGTDAVETGVVTEVRGSLVFVRYGGDSGAKATRPDDLTLMSRY